MSVILQCNAKQFIMVFRIHNNILIFIHIHYYILFQYCQTLLVTASYLLLLCGGMLVSKVTCASYFMSDGVVGFHSSRIFSSFRDFFDVLCGTRVGYYAKRISLLVIITIILILVSLHYVSTTELSRADSAPEVRI